MARRDALGRKTSSIRLAGWRRRLALERLEERRLLAITVDTHLDVVDINDGVTSLREAIFAANTAGGADTIDFSPALTADGPVTILLTQGELAITEALTIDGPGSLLLTIDAQQQSRIFNVTATTGDITLDGLKLTRGHLQGNNSPITSTAFAGGAVRSVTTGTLVISECAIVHNSIVGGNTMGGGVFASGAIVVMNSEVTDNKIEGAPQAGLDHSGGGIRGLGDVTLRQTIVRGNTVDATTQSGHANGGGIYADGSITLEESVVEDNLAEGGLAAGGGIFTMEDVTVMKSKISKNTAFSNARLSLGGGIRAIGAATVTDSSIVDNVASGVSPIGGGINVSGALTIERSTISGNSAWRGGGLVTNSNVTIRYSTVTANNALSAAGGMDGATSGAHTINIFGSIIAGNTAADGGADLRANKANVNAHYSMIGNNSLSSLAEAPIGSPDANGNLIGGPVNGEIDALLGPLADNGGATWTHALLVGSPAIDRGDPLAVAGVDGVPLVDQRGETFGRVVDGDGAGGARIDIGAFERQTGETFDFVVDTLEDENDGDYSTGDFSLREAIALANANPGSDTIEFADVLTAHGAATILLTLGQLSIVDAVTIDGPGAQQLSIDASGNDPTPDVNNGDGSRILAVSDGASSLVDVEIEGLTLTGADSNSSGGAIFSFERLRVSQCVITQNSADSGGGIKSHNGELMVIGSEISNNSSIFGGGISSDGPFAHAVTVKNSTISGNSSATGGGIHSHDGGLTIQSSTISGNISKYAGGGIYVAGSASPFVISSSTIVNNVANTAGYPFLSTTGAGVNVHNPFAPVAIVENSIIAENFQADGTQVDFRGSIELNRSLLGIQTAQTHITDNGGNLIGTLGSTIDPLLGPLVNNGGATRTHTLLPGSPALDAGDPAAVVAGVDGVPEFDQRGGPWSRVVGGRIDIGAVEAQANPLPGDYNFNGVVDAADYTVWRDTVGSENDLRADGSGAVVGVPDGVVDALDYSFWKANFGNVWEAGEGAVSEGQGGSGLAASQRLAGEEVAAVVAAEVEWEGIWVGGGEKTAALGEGRRAVSPRLLGGSDEDRDRLLAWVTLREGVVDEEEGGASLFEGDSADEDSDAAALDLVFAAMGGGI